MKYSKCDNFQFILNLTVFTILAAIFLLFKMHQMLWLLIAFVILFLKIETLLNKYTNMGHTILNSWNGGHLGRHLESLKMFNDASWASFGFFKNNIFPNRIANIVFNIQYNAVSYLELTGLYVVWASYIWTWIWGIQLIVLNGYGYTLYKMVKLSILTISFVVLWPGSFVAMWLRRLVKRLILLLHCFKSVYP